MISRGVQSRTLIRLRIVDACESCGEVNSDRARFCQKCGAPLRRETKSAVREVRKTVTILFCDLVGSTELGEKLDPESVRAIIHRYFERMSVIIAGYGGTIEKYIGDAIMAVFGIPALHEDDAQRACRAAIDMRDALSAFNRELEREVGVTLESRTGINTGEVFLGGGEETLVTGDAANVAARLEQAAQPGEILIGDITFRLVRDAILTEPVEALTLKGKSAPVKAHHLKAVREGAEAIARDFSSPLVGRDEEAYLLVQAFERVVRDRSCHLFTILGPPGIGKSRLARELVDAVDDQSEVLSGRCLAYGDGITYFAMNEILSQAAGVRAEEDLAKVILELRRRLGDSLRATAIVDTLSPLLGATDIDVTSEAIFRAVRWFFELLARERPLIVLIDDVHWAEPTLLDLIEHVAEWSRDAPILLLCIGRSELLEARPAWGGGKLNATSIQLEPLDSRHVERLIANLGPASLSSATRDRIIAIAEGNPLFVEEIVAMLIDTDVVRGQRSGALPAGDLDLVEIPPTIQALIAARLDRLTDDERAVAERASIVGMEFSHAILKALSADEESRERLDPALLGLVRKELIRPDPTSSVEDDEFRFRHSLIREAAYQSMPKGFRSDLHETLGSWLEMSADSAVANDEIAGHHFERAATLRAELSRPDPETARRAAEHLSVAADRAMRRGDNVARRKLLTRSASLLRRRDSHRIAMLPEIGEVMYLLGDIVDSGKWFLEAEELAAGVGDGRSELRAKLGILTYRNAVDPTLTGEETVEKARRILDELALVGDARDVALAHLRIASGFWMMARFTEAAQAYQRAAETLKGTGDPATEAMAGGLVVHAAAYGMTPVDEVVALCDQMAAEADRLPVMEPATRLMRLLMLAHDGDVRDADLIAEQSRAQMLEQGMGGWIGIADDILGGVALVSGDAEAAIEHYRRMFDLSMKSGDTGVASTSAANIGWALVELDRNDEALRWAARSGEMAAPDDATSQIGWRVVRARVLTRGSAVGEALTLAAEAIEIADRSDCYFTALRAQLAMAEVLDVAGRKEDAADHLRRALSLCERKGASRDASRVREWLARVI